MRPVKQDEHKALFTINGECVDWTGHAKDDIENYALMAFNSSNSGSDTKMSAKDKSGLGYGNQIHKGALSYENEDLESVFDSRSSDVEDNRVNDRFSKVKGMHAVPLPMTGIYMPSKYDFGIDDVETLESVSKPVESKPKAVSEPKVWSDAPIIEEYESDSDDECVSKALVEQEKPSCAFINTVKHVKTPRQTVKDQDTCIHNPKVPKEDWTGLMSKRLGLGYGYTRKTCFVCGSFSHLIRDCDFHKNRMAKQVKLNKGKNTVTCQKNDRLVWNNMQRLNHQNKFVPTAILTKTGKFPVNVARQNFSSQAVSTNTIKKVNTARPIVNEIRPRNNVYKSHSPIRWPFNRTPAPKAKFSNHKVTTAGDKTDNPYQTLKGKGIVDSGCSRHMTGNKAYLVEYQDFNGGHVAFREFKNNDIIKFCALKGIKREYSDARTLQQNRVAERKNMTLIEAARTMQADSFLPKTFWVEAVSTACYVLNRVLVTKPQNRTPYELITVKIPIISYIRPFRCHVTTLNTIDHLGKFEEKSDEGFLVGYSLNIKAFMVYNLETKRVEENLHINFLENTPNVTGKVHTWLFDLDYLTNSMNHQPVTAENIANKTAGPKEANNSTAKNGDQKLNRDTGSKKNKEPVDQDDQAFLEVLEKLKRQEKETDDAAKNLRKTFAQGTKDLLLQAGGAGSTNYVNTASTPVNTASTLVNTASPLRNISSLEDIYEVPNDGIFISASYDDEGAVANFTNLESTMNVSLIPNLGYTLFILQLKFLEIQTQQFRQGAKQEEGIDYDEVFAPVARIEAIHIFLAFASYIGFIVYQMDVKSAFLYGKIDEKVYVSQPTGFIDHKFLKKVYKVVKALYGLHQAPRAWYATLSTFLVQSGYIRGLIDKTLFIKKDNKDIILVKQKEDGIFISQDKYVAEILKKFDLMSVKTASTSIETKKPLVKDAEATDVTPKTLHLHVVKRIFRYLKRQPKLGLWYPRESAFDLEAYSDSEYAGANLDRKSTTGGFQFLGRRLVSWQCKKQTIVATSTIEAEYVAAASCCGQVLWTRIKYFSSRIHPFRYGFSKNENFGACIQTRGKKAKIGLNIEEGNFNKLDDLVGKGNDYAVNEERSTDKIKVLNPEAEGVSTAGETLSTATLTVSTPSVQPVLLCSFKNQEAKIELTSPKQTAFGKDFLNSLMADSSPKTIWLSMHHVIAMKHWLFQSKRLLNKEDKVTNEFKFIKEKIRE
nr:hypothetical protein [Tanacetum cinerariifolium]